MQTYAKSDILYRACLLCRACLLGQACLLCRPCPCHRHHLSHTSIDTYRSIAHSITCEPDHAVVAVQWPWCDVIPKHTCTCARIQARCQNHASSSPSQAATSFSKHTLRFVETNNDGITYKITKKSFQPNATHSQHTHTLSHTHILTIQTKPHLA